MILKKAENERQKALAGSSVKIHGWDVLASFKILYGLMVFFVFSLILDIAVFVYGLCKGYSDIFDSVSDAVSLLLTFILIWPTYLYLSIILSDKAMQNFSKLYFRALSICSPRALNSLKGLREELKEAVRELVKKFGPEIFPSLKGEKAPKKIELNESINNAFGFLAEIGFN